MQVDGRAPVDSIQFGYRVAFDGEGAGYLPDTGGVIDGGIQTDAGRFVDLRSSLSRVGELLYKGVANTLYCGAGRRVFGRSTRMRMWVPLPDIPLMQ